MTTAARGFDTESRGRRREADIFRGGVETRASRIKLPEELQPFEWAPKDENARVHEFTSDTHIRFLGDGSYTWRTRGSKEPDYLNEPSEHPVYFVAAGDATLYVQGVVAGRVLVYSPHRIVVEGSLTYAHDPRDPDSRDYLGLVCDRYIEVAPPGVTGPGDLEIDAAIFAGRRFVVTNIEHPRSRRCASTGVLRPEGCPRPSRATPRRSNTITASSDSVHRASHQRIDTRSRTGTANGPKRCNKSRTTQLDRVLATQRHSSLTVEARDRNCSYGMAIVRTTAPVEASRS